jgi:hypothetical protein
MKLPRREFCTVASPSRKHFYMSMLEAASGKRSYYVALSDKYYFQTLYIFSVAQLLSCLLKNEFLPPASKK